MYAAEGGDDEAYGELGGGRLAHARGVGDGESRGGVLGRAVVSDGRQLHEGPRLDGVQALEECELAVFGDGHHVDRAARRRPVHGPDGDLDVEVPEGPRVSAVGH